MVLIFSKIGTLLGPLPTTGLEGFLRLRPAKSLGEPLSFELFMTRLGSSSRSLIRLSSELELDNDSLPLDSRLIRSEALEEKRYRKCFYGLLSNLTSVERQTIVLRTTHELNRYPDI